jgi:hypothetical protein
MRGFLLPVFVTGSFLAAALPGQSSPALCQPGFAAVVPFGERPQAFLVRGTAYDEVRDQHWLALGGTLWRRPDPWTWNAVLQLTAPDQIGALVAGQRHIWCTALQGGTVFAVDPGTSAFTSFAGVANAFDLAVGPGGEVMLSANPLWPAPAADSGLWHVGPQLAPREVLHLSGPSGPLRFDPAGNLLVAEIGRTLPVPPGAVRILRFARSRWQRALSDGLVLTTLDAELVSTGWDGAYGMACDDGGRVYVSDPNRRDVLRTLPGTLQRDPVPFCTLPAVGLQLQFVPGKGAPFVPYQPRAHAGALLASSSNFISEFLVHRIAPERPALDASPGPVIGPGPATLQVHGAPASGLAVFAAGTAPLRTEYLAGLLEGSPLWWALDPAAAVATLVVPLDAGGNASVALHNPGGLALAVQWQVLALASASHCTTAPLSLQFLP